MTSDLSLVFSDNLVIYLLSAPDTKFFPVIILIFSVKCFPLPWLCDIDLVILEILFSPWSSPAWDKENYLVKTKIYSTCLRHLQYLIFYFHWKKANMWAICEIYVWNIRRRSPMFAYLLLDDLQTLQLVSRSSRPEAEEETLDLLLRILGRLHRILSSLLYGPSSSCI